MWCKSSWNSDTLIQENIIYIIICNVINNQKRGEMTEISAFSKKNCRYVSWSVLTSFKFKPWILYSYTSTMTNVQMPKHLLSLHGRAFLENPLSIGAIICQSLLVTDPMDFNSSPPSAAYMCQWIRSALVQIMARRLFGAQPSYKPMPGYC